MVGQKLSFGTGACWGALTDAAALLSSSKGGGAKLPSLFVPDVSEHEGVHFFPGGVSAASASG